MASGLLVGLAGFGRPGNPAGKAIARATNKSGMNGNILIGVFAEQNKESGFGAVLQNYWYGFLVVPCILLVAKSVRQKRRGKVYRW